MSTGNKFTSYYKFIKNLIENKNNIIEVESINTFSIFKKFFAFELIFLIMFFISSNIILLNYYTNFYVHIPIETFILICLVLTVFYIVILKVIKNKFIFLIMFFIWFPIFLLSLVLNINYHYIFFETKFLFYILKALLSSETILISVLIFLEIRILQKEKEKLLEFKKNKISLKEREKKLIISGEMLNNIVHQWKQPLSRINAILFNINTSFVSKELNTKDLENKIQLVENETKDMSEIINSFISYLDPNTEESSFNLYDLVEELINNINKTIQKQIKVSLICSNKNLFISGYKKYYEQVLYEILDNAIFEVKDNLIKNPEIIFNIDMYDNKVRLRIINNGSNLPEEELKKIFQPYYSTKNAKGRGIGLHMSKMLIENSMKKELLVENTKIGVTFTIIG